jgi:peptide/nickel transport system ATP-binding protein/oligopeptide transport system ATP-binding protein
MTLPIISVRDLQVRFPSRDGVDAVRAIDGVSFDVLAGETLGIIGESGSGKTTLGRALVSLLKPTAGELRHDGVDLSGLPARELRERRRDYQIVFQDPNAALNPRRTIFDSVREPLEIIGADDAASIDRKALEALSRVGIAPELAQRVSAHAVRRPEAAGQHRPGADTSSQG